MVAKVTLVGNIGKEPEIKAYGDKRAARFSIAVNRWVKKEKTTMWVNVVVWDQKGRGHRELCQQRHEGLHRRQP